MEKFFKHPWVIIAVIAVITVFFAAQLPKARINNNLNFFLPDDIPERVIARHFEEEYGDNVMIMVGLRRPYGTVFDGGFLHRIREFTTALEEIALVDDTNSIMSTQYITSDSESIIVTDLVGEDFSGSAAEIAELKRRLDSWDLYRGSLISDDLSSTQLIVTLKAPADEAGEPEVVAALVRIRDLAKEMFADFADVYTAGEPVVSATIAEAILADIFFLVPLVLVVLLGVLIFSFRRASFVLLPLLTVLVVVIWAAGAIPFFNVTMTLVSMVIPIIMVAVGSAYAIHIVSHYKDETDGKTFTVEEHRAMVLALIRKMRKPVVLAALTTFAGFISFCFGPLVPIRDFGIFASFGVISAVAVALTLVPAILIIRGPQAVKLAAQKKKPVKKIVFDFENELADTLSAVAKKKPLVLAVTAVLIVASIIGATKLIVDTSLVEFFNDDTEVSRSDRFIREQFGGSNQFVVSVEADDTQTLLSPEVLGAVDGLCAYLTERVPVVGKVTGFTDMVKRMNQMFNVDESPDGVRPLTRLNTNENLADEFGFGDFGEFGNFGSTKAVTSVIEDPPDSGQENQLPGFIPVSSDSPVTFERLNAAAGKRPGMSANELVWELERLANYGGYSYYEIPTDPARYGKQNGGELQQLVSNYLVLLAGDSDETMSNDPLEPTAIQTIILINSQWQKDIQTVIRAINEYVDANFPKTVRVLIGGGAAQLGAFSRLIKSSQVVSIFISVLIVLLIVAFSNKSLAIGLIAALSLLVAVMGNFAVMGFFGITLNVSTALIASLAVGVGIDYTIHFIEAFKREYKDGGDYLHRTFATSGKAILINAVSVGAGFGVLIFSQFRIMAQFGALITLSMAVSAVVSLTVVPVLITLVKPKFIYGQDSASR